MAKVKITKAVCLELEPDDPGREELYWDVNGSGLGVRVTRRLKSGRRGRYFIFGYTRRPTDPDGRPQKPRWRVYQLGSVARWTLDRAREEVDRLNHLVNQGHDPVVERKRSYHRVSEALTIRDLAELHLRRHHKAELSEPAPGESGYVKENRSRWLNVVLPMWGERLVSEIDSGTVAELLYKVAENRPVAANRLRSMLSKAFSLAEVWGLRPRGSNPVSDISKQPEKGRERVFRREELRALMNALDQLLKVAEALPPKMRASQLRQLYCVALLAETGMRPKEVFGLRWEWVLWSEGILDLPKAKHRARGRRVGLSQRALEILRELETLAEGSGWVFPSVRSEWPITTVRAVWPEILAVAGIEDSPSLYTLRHTYVTLADDVVGLGAAQVQAGHTDVRTTQRYHHADDDTLVHTATAMGEYLDSIRKGGDRPKPRRLAPRDRAPRADQRPGSAG